MRLFSLKWLSPLLIPPILAISCTPGTEQNSEETSTTPLKEVLEDDFFIGAALNYDQVYGREDQATDLVKEHFNTMKIC